MNIVIIGWYGTETIGDRAILAGLFHAFSQAYGRISIKIGCLDTLLTERTILEDYDFFLRCSKNKLNLVSLFDSRRITELDNAIKWGDIVVIGGGPLMEIEALYMLCYAFEKAKILGRKTVAAGCGMGPFKTERLLRLAVDIINLSDVTVFRDSKSKELYESYSKSKHNNCFASIDPASFASQCYRDLNENGMPFLNNDYIAVNFREPPKSEYAGLYDLGDEYFVNMLKSISKTYSTNIHLVPMHTFWLGDDDRFMLNRICRKVALPNVFVYNKPLSLEQTMNVFSNARCCYGMRFHAVLLQTILNGRNVVLDYTDPQKGKIANLLNQFDLMESYKERYVSLVTRPFIPLNCDMTTKTDISKDIIDCFEDIYIKCFINLVS